MAIALSAERAVAGRFGPYGGRYVPETLVAALDDLRRAVRRRARRSARSGRSSTACSRSSWAGPSPLTEAPRLGAETGATVVLKREDLNHTGAHKINNTIGQALLALPHGQAAHHRGDRRGPARGGDRHRLRALRPRLRGLHGGRGRRAAAAQCLPHAAARRDGRAGRVGHAHAEGRDQRGAPRLGDQRARRRTTSSARSSDPTPIRAWCATSSP